MSPEQAEGKPLDARSDIFSFGALLYEMASGQRAFSGESRVSTLAMILREEPRPLSGIGRNVPIDLEKIIRRCLRKDPARRFHHMIDVKVALDDLKEDSESGAAAAIASERRRPRAVWFAVGAGALLLIALVGAYTFYERTPAATTTPTTVAPLTAYPGVEAGPTFSPDGNQVAFTWSGPDSSNDDIYIKLVGPGDHIRLTTDPAVDLSPAWSPDGRWIAFVRLLPGARAGFFLIPALGGPERQVGETSSEPYLDSLPAPLVAWSLDTRWLFVPDKQTANEDFGLFLLSVDTGEKRRLTTPLPGGADSGAAVSPDGRRLAFVRQRGWGLTNIALLSLSTDSSGTPSAAGEPVLLPSVEPDNRSPAWTPDGREIVFSSGLFRSATNLWRIAASAGAQPARLSQGGADGSTVSIWRPDAASGRPARMAYRQMTFDTDIWRVELSDRGTRVGAPVRLLSSSRRDFTAVYSSNGKRIAFFSDRSGRAEIWVANADGSGAFQLTSRGVATVVPPAWSPDGEHIAFVSAEEGQGWPYIARASGGEPRRLGAELGSYFLAGFSADSRSVYLFLPGPSSPFLLKKVPVQGGAAVEAGPDELQQIFDELQPTMKVMNPDRSRGYLASGNEPASLWEVPTAAMRSLTSLVAPQSIPGARQIIPALFHGLNYVVSRQGVYFMPRISRRFYDASGQIHLYRFATGEIEDVAALDKPPFFGLDISPDGRWLLYSQMERLDGDLMLVENFR
jgi:Tol biopolymer transport system component